MSSIWFTSDLHIGHPSVARQRFLPARIDDAAAVKWHDAHLARNWDAVVRPDDQVWILGDLTLGGAEAVAYGLNWIRDRPGVKHLITGNHDPCHPLHRDAHKWQATYLKVFASVQAFARRKVAGKDVLLSHFPYSGDHGEVERYREYRLQDFGLPLLHGHTHSRERLSNNGTRWLGDPVFTPCPGSIQIHVGVDAWNLAPVNMTELESVIAKDPLAETTGNC